MDALREYDNIPYEKTESWLQRRDRVKTEKKERQEMQVVEGFDDCETDCFVGLDTSHLVDNF